MFRALAGKLAVLVAVGGSAWGGGSAWAQAGAASAEIAPAKAGEAFEALLTAMTGSFSSADQAAKYPQDYFDIRLRMVRIWPSRTDKQDRIGDEKHVAWLYVEQAAASSLDKPYRQRIYRVSEKGDGTFESVVFALPGDPLKFAGAWRDLSRFDELRPQDLQKREGCSITLKREADGSFKGGTTGNECASDLRGASYATSEAVIFPDRMVTWDRGYDKDGNQVWGAEKGGYVFQRVKE